MAASAHRFVLGLRRSFLRGGLPIWILERLASGPRYGYELMAELRAAYGPELFAGPSALYPTLGRLRRAGLVRVFHGRVSRGPLRKYYELTDHGRELLPELHAMTQGFRRDPALAPGLFGSPEAPAP